jgi:hypothetical protein
MFKCIYSIKSSLKTLASFQTSQFVCYPILGSFHFHTYTPLYGKKKDEKKSPKTLKKSKARQVVKPETVEPETVVQNDSEMSIKVLNVAEKNDAAKNIAQLLSNGNARRVGSAYLLPYLLLRLLLFGPWGIKSRIYSLHY